MISGLVKQVGLAIPVYCAGWTGNDPLTGIVVYQDEEFNPDDETTYKRLLNQTNYSAVIWGVTSTDDPVHPYSHIKVRVECNVTFLRKTENFWSTLNRLFRPLRKQDNANDLPYMNSLWDVAIGWTSFLDRLPLTTGTGDYAFNQHAEVIDRPIVKAGFVSVTTHCSFYAMYPRNPTLSPV